MDADKTDLDFQQDEYNEIKENAQLKAIISGQKAKRQSIKVGDIEIFIRPAIPKGLRDRILQIAESYKAGDTCNADVEIYEVLSKLCLEAPFTKPAAWRLIDEETGEVPNLMSQIIEKITATEGVAKRFR